MKLLTLSELVINARNIECESGGIEGTCCMCGNETKEGHIPKFSDRFTAGSKLCYGEVICPECKAFFENQEHRRKTWIVTEDFFEVLDRKKAREHILNPPKPPFFIYLTKGGQKQGWLGHFNKLNYSTEIYQICCEWSDSLIQCNKSTAVEMDKLITELRSRKVSKTELLTTEYKMKTYEKAIKNNFENLLESTKQYKNNPLWEVMLHVSD